jgi:hypothetical protein
MQTSIGASHECDVPSVGDLEGAHITLALLHQTYEFHPGGQDFRYESS